MSCCILLPLLVAWVSAGVSILPPEWRTELIQEQKFFKRETADEVQPMGDSIEEVNTKSGVAATLFQGDIVLSKEQRDQIAEDISRARSKRQAYNDKTYTTLKWSNGVAYMLFELDEETKSSFKKAAKLWMDDTCINFTEYNPMIRPKPPKPEHYLLVIKGPGCSSDLGRKVSGGPQQLSLGKGCETIGHAAHEIGHALGFFHTHTRHDRDQFIEVDTKNIESDWDKQFERQTTETNNNYNLTYDYGSVMHYGSSSVTANKRTPVMVAKDKDYTETLGSDIISFYDLLMMNMLYNCVDTCKAVDTKCQNDGFPHPRDCSKCICPSGYGGKLCETRPEGCGSELVAEDQWNTLEAEQDGSKASDQRDGFMRCNYWIKAPDDKKVEVEILELRDMVAVDGCKHAGVEIKTHSDKRLTGYRFCSKREVYPTLKSNSSIVPVITYNRQKQTTVTKLRYRSVQ